MKMIVKGVCGIWYYIWGHLFALLYYDSKYLRGRWFDGRMNGLCALGWRWVVHDGWQRLFSNKNKGARFPVSNEIKVLFPENIEFDPDDLHNFQGFGNYYQAIGKIILGKGTYIAPNVGIITSNHNIKDLNEHDTPEPVTIGENCWIGMNSILLPGVVLGNNTVVGAGSVVTKSYPDGYQIIAGNPAKIIRKIDHGKS